jgi:ribulose-bisphosphate carboxylase large chain
LNELRATYELTLRQGESAREKAGLIAYEQTIELPPGVAPPRIERQLVARLGSVRAAGPRRALVTLSFSPRLIDAPAQLLNVLFGNVSMQSGVRLVDLEWPVSLLRRLPGPALGIGGVRAACGVDSGRALSCVALKPLGMTAHELARRAGVLATGGIDLIKEDQSLGDQRMAPFRERVRRCQEALDRANATGRSAVYLPHLTGAGARLEEKLEIVLGAGCGGVLISPLLAGLDALAEAARRGLIVLAHPSLTGGLFGNRHGIAPRLLWGDIFRVAGADGVIFPNAGGRFPIRLEECLAVAEHLRRPLGPMRPSLPVIGGGVDLQRIPQWLRRYGRDLVVLIGGGLYREPDLGTAAARLRQVLERTG